MKAAMSFRPWPIKSSVAATLNRAADVESPHRKLSAGFADGLGRDDADGLADVDRRAAGQVASVTFSANAFLQVAGENAPVT